MNRKTFGALLKIFNIELPSVDLRHTCVLMKEQFSRDADVPAAADSR